MSLRWLVIIAIGLWLIYEYTNHMWVNVWTVHSKNIKCVFAILVILVLFCAPSFESIIQNSIIQSYLQKFLMNDAYQYHYQYPQKSIDMTMMHHLQSGAQIAKQHT